MSQENIEINPKIQEEGSISFERPYKPSWFDVFNQWVERLPVNMWLFHLLFGILLVLIHVFFLWLDGNLLTVEIFPIIIFNSFAIPFLFLMMHLLDKQAIKALSTMQPVLDITQEENQNYAYQLSNLPFLAPLVAATLLMLITILLPSVTISPLRYAVLEQLPTFNVVFHILDKSSAFLFGVLIYHTIRQLRLVNQINHKIGTIHLFNLGPLQGFSRLTGTTAIGLLVFVYPWMLINPELLSDPILFAIIAIFTFIAILVFLWPLWGVHRIIEQEKQKELLEINTRFETQLSRFNQHIDHGEFAEAEKLSGIITSFDVQHKRIKAIPTWPWSPEIARLVLTAIALPIVLMILQYFIVQALDR